MSFSLKQDQKLNWLIFTYCILSQLLKTIYQSSMITLSWKSMIVQLQIALWADNQMQWVNSTVKACDLFAIASITSEFSQSMIPSLVALTTIVPKPQLHDGRLGFGCQKTAVLGPLVIIRIAVASRICVVCARASYSACALLRIIGVTSSPVRHLISIRWHPQAILETKGHWSKAFVLDKLLTVGGYDVRFPSWRWFVPM